MANDLLKKLEEKINEAIETIELSRMEVLDLKEQNEELENRYSDWETKLSTLIEKFETLEDSGDEEVEAELNVTMQSTDENSEEKFEAELNETFQGTDSDSEEEIEVTEATDAEDEEEEVSDEVEVELGSTFDTNSESLSDSSETAQHYA